MKAPEVMALLHTTSDADLVASCLGGNRTAFEQIVERYQRLLCSVAYSSLGDVGESEDVAQETFVTAWLKLGELREPDKLRPWLCSILRFKVSHARRRDGREPVRGAAPLEGALDVPDGEITGDAAAMAREEQALLWSALRTLPENYREPLVLFYREHRSIEHVAVELDLTEDAVKQRLARGRQMLTERLLAVVEGALARSSPGKVFTVGVLAALPALTPPAQAAGLGAAAVAATKGAGGLTKTIALATILASVTGLVSAVISLRMSLDQARTDRERRAVLVMTALFFTSFLAFLLVLFGARFLVARAPENLPVIAVLHHLFVVVFTVGWSWALLREIHLARERRSAERRRVPEKFADPVDQVGSPQSEYRSSASLFGVPLVHVRFAVDESHQGPAFGWVAGGDRAVGLLFAFGGWAVGCVSVGGVSLGVFSLGAVSAGLLSIGTISLGVVALGAVAAGWHAVGSLSATAWHTAFSPGFAFSNWVAAAPLALAPHANDAVARAALVNPNAEREWLVLCVIIVVLGLVPTTLYARAVRRRLGRKEAPPPP
ncbi:MAG: sigma-70 family RNA polymerase sigma factor [Opitutae bacterium]|nr:sigma-70 family RNA polymerase sigma factor [Opitutae bacterium]